MLANLGVYLNDMMDHLIYIFGQRRCGFRYWFAVLVVTFLKCRDPDKSNDVADLWIQIFACS